MATSVHVTKAGEIKSGTGHTAGMDRQGAIIDLADNISASVMIAQPHTKSAIHHHGDQNTIVYGLTGHGAIVSDGGKTRQELDPGDFALIPAGAEHQEVNDGDEIVRWIITRSGRIPEVVNLEGWS
ncbi:hypothetical protein MMC09_002288 [Bachmanniomyces sp. S44760]|nr:hypothetical protein [Bachmanniomyces sp. S44760]